MTVFIAGMPVMMTCVQLRGHTGLGLLGVLFLAAHVTISQNSFHVASRSAAYENHTL